MPTYEYACSSCGHRLEAVQRFSDDALTVCPECGGALRKVYGAVGIVLKGPGFYRTDSRAASGTNGSSRAASDGATSSEGKERAGSGEKADSAGKADSADTKGTAEKKKESSSGGDGAPAKPAAANAG